MSKKVLLKNICSFLSGGTPKTSNPSYWNGSIPWISIKDIISKNRYIFFTEKNITKLGLNNSATSLLQQNDIILSARGTVGEVALISKPMAFNQSCYGLRCNNHLLPIYLFYWLKANKQIILGNTHGSVFDTITRETLNRVEITLPSLTEQQHIVDLIGSIDDKIENNEIKIEKLKQLGLVYINDYLSDFENAEPLEKHIKFIKGIEPGSKAYLNEQSANSVPFVRGKTLESRIYDTFIVSDNTMPTAKKNDVLIAFDGAAGRTACGLTGIYSSGIRKAASCSKYNLSDGFIYFYLNSKYIQNIILAFSQARTTIIHAGKSIDEMELPIRNEITELSKKLSIIYNKIIDCYAENENLNKLKQKYFKKFFD